jgi:hypothetical protein
MYHQRVGQQRAEHVELALPMPRQLIKQCIGLRFLQAQVLEKVEERTGFVKRQAHNIDQIGELRDYLQAELAAAKHAGDFAILVVRASIDLVSDQRRSAVFQPPHRPSVRQSTGIRCDTLGKNGLGSLGLRDLVAGFETTASPLLLFLALLLAPSLLSLFFRPHGEWLIELRRSCAAKFFLEFFDDLLSRFQLLLRRFELLLCCLELLLHYLELTLNSHDQIDKPFGADPPLSHILLQCLDRIHARSILLFPAHHGNRGFIECTAT